MNQVKLAKLKMEHVHCFTYTFCQHAHRTAYMCPSFLTSNNGCKPQEAVGRAILGLQVARALLLPTGNKPGQARSHSLPPCYDRLQPCALKSHATKKSFITQ